MQPRVHFRVSNLCILRRLTAFCGQTPQGLFATGGPERRTSPCVAKPVGSGIRNWHGTSGSRFNDSTGDGSLPPEWAQDRVSQGPRGSPCNNLPSLVGKSRGQCRDCYRAATSTNKARNKAGSAVRTQKRLGDPRQAPAFCGSSHSSELDCALCILRLTFWFTRAFCVANRKVVA